VTFQESGGSIRARFDAVGTNPNGSLGVFEFKNGPGAALNSNQVAVAEDIASGGEIPRGGNALNAGLMRGNLLAPPALKRFSSMRMGLRPVWAKHSCHRQRLTLAIGVLSMRTNEFVEGRIVKTDRKRIRGPISLA
jgi:hypothetical protein